MYIYNTYISCSFLTLSLRGIFFFLSFFFHIIIGQCKPEKRSHAWFTRLKLSAFSWNQKIRSAQKTEMLAALPRGICDFFAIVKLMNGYQKMKTNNSPRERGGKKKRTVNWTQSCGLKSPVSKLRSKNIKFHSFYL